MDKSFKNGDGILCDASVLGDVSVLIGNFSYLFHYTTFRRKKIQLQIGLVIGNVVKVPW